MMRFRGADLLGVVVLALWTACAPAAEPNEIGERVAALGSPHFVLIVTDTLRADATTPYGADTTPELERWAQRGVVFERTRSQSSWTKIAMASLLTSTWPRTHGIRTARDALGSVHRTLAEALHDAGYDTYAVQTNGWLHQSFDFHRGFDRYAFPVSPGAIALDRATLWTHADRVLEEAFRLIDAHDASRPMFLYLHFMDVHEYAAPPEFHRFGSDSKGAYHAAAHWVDDAVRRVRTKLADQGMLDRTVMVFTADHGETFGEHGVWGHARNVQTPVVSVPLVFRFPFAVEALRVPTQVRGIDLAPTILELAGVERPDEFEGASLLSLLEGGAEPDRPTFAALGQLMFTDAHDQAAISDGRWTFVRNREDPEAIVEQLFDRSVDPVENVDLIVHESGEASRLRGELDAHLAREQAAARRGVEIDARIAERLRAMGYVTGPE